MQTIEILSPAGDWERLEAAVRFGADAVYLGGAQFDMRAAAAGFGPDELSRAVVYAHENDVNVYLVCNTLATNEETDRLPDFLKMAHSAGVDALI
ncbi:MAG: peptidase U32 family protein, partial [Anaerotruncus colihominis]